MTAPPSYIDKNFQYTNPPAYDNRINRPIERYTKSLWLPILRRAIERHITPMTTVCDLGCGTLEHTQYMSRARHVWAIDTSADMIAHGQPKIRSWADKVTTRTEDALATSLADGICDVIWSVGLTEYVDLARLFAEITRLGHSGSRLLVQFPNGWHPLHLFLSVCAPLVGKKMKKYRTLPQIRAIASRYGWRLENVQSAGIFLPGPPWLMDALIPLWRLMDWLYAPLQNSLPLGVNVWCEFTRQP